MGKWPIADAWFAGFAAGEGCFLVSTHGVPVFTITCRADDAAVLDQLAAAFGGRIRGHIRRPPANPVVVWTVSAKRDLVGLVSYFDRYTLRAKKAADYALWRLAVDIYAKHGRHGEGLNDIRLALIEGRRFAAETLTPRLEDRQLRLVVGG